MRYEMTADHINHGAGVVICRGELPLDGEIEFRHCTEYLTIEMLVEFSSAVRKTLNFHVATTENSIAVPSWLEWDQHDATAVVLHLELHEALMHDGVAFDTHDTP